jgi:hypothetical protein
MAMHRAWNRTYGSEIIALSTDVLECLVAKPPTDRTASDRLAWQQFGYCDDIVHQGMQTVGRLSGILANSPYWYFWWD